MDNPAPWQCIRSPFLDVLIITLRMKTFSYIALSLTLALAFCLWLPNNLSFTIIWMGTAFLGFPLLIADIIAFIYLVRHWREKGVKGLAVLFVLIPVVLIIGMNAPGNSSYDEIMFKHYQRHENDLRELIQYAESLTDSVTVSFPSDSIPKEVSKEQYDHVIQLLKKTQCEGIKTYFQYIWGKKTMVVFRNAGFGGSGYLSFPDKTIKVYRWDPLGSDSNGIYDIDTPPFKCSIELPR